MGRSSEIVGMVHNHEYFKKLFTVNLFRFSKFSSDSGEIDDKIAELKPRNIVGSQNTGR